MTPEEALDSIEHVYHTPLAAVVRAELGRLLSERDKAQSLADLRLEWYWKARKDQERAEADLAAARADAERLRDVLRSGYYSSSCTSNDDALHDIHLHYCSREQAVAAFNAFTDFIDAALAKDKE